LLRQSIRSKFIQSNDHASSLKSLYLS